MEEKGGRKIMDTRKKKSLRIFRNAQGWAVEFVDDPTIQSLFGSTILPTPYTAAMPAMNVLKKIQELNPECIVSLSEEGERVGK